MYNVSLFFYKLTRKPKLQSLPFSFGKREASLREAGVKGPNREQESLNVTRNARFGNQEQSV